MSKTTENRYVPDYAIHPGEILEEYLSVFGMTQIELSDCTGITLKHIDDIIRAKAPVTPETAIELERVFGRPAHFWSNLERLYEKVTVRLAGKEQLFQEEPGPSSSSEGPLSLACANSRSNRSRSATNAPIKTALG